MGAQRPSGQGVDGAVRRLSAILSPCIVRFLWQFDGKLQAGYGETDPSSSVVWLEVTGRVTPVARRRAHRPRRLQVLGRWPDVALAAAVAASCTRKFTAYCHWRIATLPGNSSQSIGKAKPSCRKKGTIHGDRIEDRCLTALSTLWPLGRFAPTAAPQGAAPRPISTGNSHTGLPVDYLPKFDEVITTYKNGKGCTQTAPAYQQTNQQRGLSST